MSLEEYLVKNISPDILQKISEFQKSSSYRSIRTHSLSEKYQSDRLQLKLRDKDIHENTLADIQRLQENLFIN